MTVLRMDHTGLVVPDLAAAIAFFTELGLELAGEATVEGETVDRIIGLDGTRSNIAMLQTPDGHSQIELCLFDSPPSPPDVDSSPSNQLGLRHLCFAVDDVHGTLERLRPHGAELVGELVQYGDSWQLCYLRGPGGAIVELAQRIGDG